jgi:hypothetical protein
VTAKGWIAGTNLKTREKLPFQKKDGLKQCPKVSKLEAEK